MTELDNTIRQATTNKHVEILFKLIVALFSGDIALLRRTSLDILNSLKLKYSKGGDDATRKIITTDVQEIIMSFVEITYKMVWTISNIARIGE